MITRMCSNSISPKIEKIGNFRGGTEDDGIETQDKSSGLESNPYTLRIGKRGFLINNKRLGGSTEFLVAIQGRSHATIPCVILPAYKWLFATRVLQG
jgi:hypothetical protein